MARSPLKVSDERHVQRNTSGLRSIGNEKPMGGGVPAASRSTSAKQAHRCIPNAAGQAQRSSRSSRSVEWRQQARPYQAGTPPRSKRRGSARQAQPRVAMGDVRVSESHFCHRECLGVVWQRWQQQRCPKPDRGQSHTIGPHRVGNPTVYDVSVPAWRSPLKLSDERHVQRSTNGLRADKHTSGFSA